VRRVWIGLVLAVQAAAAANAVAAPSETCVRAAMEAEARWHLPEGVLQAIGLVETGRVDEATGQRGPWPWSANAGGTGYVLTSQQEATAVVGFLRAHGVTSVDVGCFQVNLRDHPNAFASIEQGFDPEANADYAARFLRELYARCGDWSAAIGAYHSGDGERARVYQAKVMQAWRGLPVGVGMPRLQSVVVSDPHVIRLSGVRPQVVVYTPETLPAELRRVLGWRGTR
jgi:hypothetical protein